MPDAGEVCTHTLAVVGTRQMPRGRLQCRSVVNITELLARGTRGSSGATGGLYLRRSSSPPRQHYRHTCCCRLYLFMPPCSSLKFLTFDNITVPTPFLPEIALTWTLTREEMHPCMWWWRSWDSRRATTNCMWTNWWICNESSNTAVTVGPPLARFYAGLDLQRGS